MRLDIEKHKLFILLVIADLAFILLHVLYVYTDLLPSNMYSLARDRGYAEFFQYVKELWLTILLLLLGIKRRRGVFWVFSLFFLYALFDDSFEFHELFGNFLADFLSIQPALGLRPVDFGELIVSVVFGLLFAIPLLLFYLLSDRPVRKITHAMLGLIAVLAGFGILMDMVGILVKDIAARRVLVILEEGGEMLVMSVITWFVFRLPLFNDPDQPASLEPPKMVRKQDV